MLSVALHLYKDIHLDNLVVDMVEGTFVQEVACKKEGMKVVSKDLDTSALVKVAWATWELELVECRDTDKVMGIGRGKVAVP